MTTCSMPDCDKRVHCRGWCGMHYERWRVHGDPEVLLRPKRAPDPVCSVDGCDGETSVRGMCRSHYDKQMAAERAASGALCSIDGCDETVWLRGWCRHHYDMWWRRGDPEAPRLRSPRT